MVKSPTALAFVVALFAIVCQSPSMAPAVTLPTATASPNPYNGMCPKIINFSGTITATAAGTITYYFAFTPPGTTVVILPQNSKITVKGPGPVTVSGSGTASNSGTGSVALVETSPVKASSALVSITTVCSSSTGTSPPQQHSLSQRVQTAPNAVAHPPSNEPLSQRMAHAPNPNMGTTATQTVHVVTATTRSKIYDYATGVHPDIFSCANPPQTLCVGYYHSESMALSVVMSHQIVTYRTYIALPKVAPRSGAVISHAFLTVHLNNPGDYNCYGGTGAATAAWEGNTIYVDGNFSYAVPSSLNGSTLTIDIAAILKDWMKGKLENYGLVMRGSNETGASFKPGDDNITCELTFPTPTTLTIMWFTPTLQFSQ